MNPSSVSELNANGIQLFDTLSVSLSLNQVVRHLGCSTEEVSRDGLGPFELVVFFSNTIGFWALAGPKVYPDFGASVWAEPATNSADLAQEVRRSLKPLRFELMNPSTGEVLD